MLAKAKDPNEKFLNYEPMCKLCLGTGSRTIYQYGKPYRKRCENATWDKDKNRFICAGNIEWQQLETENKKDLSCEIWKIVARENLKEGFMFFLNQNYQIKKLSDLLTQQLYTILRMLRSGRLLTTLSSYNLSSSQQYQLQKAA
ncbi:MAG: hypothetical protein FD167_5302 [bacterium]|nr:MAG: hypothetical protein FD167_5302 [bacterium]